MREAARSVVTIRHTYNLVDLPIRIAGKSGTAEFGVRDSKGRLPFHSVVRRVRPEGPQERQLRRSRLGADGPRLRLRLADDRQRGDGDREVLLQLHYGIKKDYRNHDLLERGNFYQGN